ncbi:alkaline phosphatase family protein [Nguyenibacter vanlangensis]|uniref:Phosphoesterase n=1 Tax=Nguyenibacter vanlangensis TaxID=1216886 RepID=A0A7Y7IZ53_9PROT|nr:alkaline phosphatase family protein [Nguyenibacter vanlangensis]NVN12688.1 hypothetical protein [Nguyenibacter vanlangensis]
MRHVIGAGRALSIGLGLLLASHAAGAADARMGLEGVPRYDNIIVIEMENRQFGQIIDARPATSPHMTRLAHEYNVATRYYGITHVSQPNYVALMSGDQQGLVDDDPWYCQADGTPLPRETAVVAGEPDPMPMEDRCGGHAAKGPYADHHFRVPNFFAQLDRAGISWAMFSQSMYVDPKTGRPAPEMPQYPTRTQNPDLYSLYVAKHNPSVNFDDIRESADFYRHNRTDTAFFRQAAAGTLPRFSYVIPDLCHDDHGPRGTLQHAPQCRGKGSGPSPLLTSGDDYVQTLVDAVRASPLWHSRRNVAIVITFDEDDYGSAGIQGCCGYHPADPNQGRVGPINQGGGLIPTIVITNHGVRGVRDDTPYNHYALLRTMEDSFGIGTYLGHAADHVAVQPADGAFRQTPVLPMVPMFRIAPSR